MGWILAAGAVVLTAGLIAGGLTCGWQLTARQIVSILLFAIGMSGLATMAVTEQIEGLPEPPGIVTMIAAGAVTLPFLMVLGITEWLLRRRQLASTWSAVVAVLLVAMALLALAASVHLRLHCSLIELAGIGLCGGLFAVIWSSSCRRKVV